MNTIFSFIYSSFFLNPIIILFVLVIISFLIYSKKLSITTRNVMIFFGIWYVLLLWELVIMSQGVATNTYNFQPFAFVWEIFEFHSRYGSQDSMLHIIVVQILLQIVLFVPAGVFVGYFWKNKILVLILLSLGIPVLTELIQYMFSSGRVIDIDDVILWFLGFWLGVLVYFLFIKIFQKFSKSSK